MRLVADLLQELQRRARPLERDRLREPRDEDLLLALRERDHGHAREIELLHRRARGGELPLPAVHDDEVRHRREALVGVDLPSACESAGDRLAHRAHVVLPGEPANREAAVVRVLRPAVLEDDHGRHDGLALDVRDVEALDPQRQALEIQHLAKLFERGDAPRSPLSALRRVRVEREARVLDGKVDEATLLAARRRTYVHAPPAPLRQELRDHGQVRDSRGDEHLRWNARQLFRSTR